MKANNKTVCTSINKLSNNNKNNETKYLIMSNQGNQNNGSSTHPKYSVGDVLRNFTKFTEKHLHQSLFLIKLQAFY